MTDEETLHVEHTDGDKVDRYDALGRFNVYTGDGLASSVLYTYMDGGTVAVSETGKQEYVLYVSGDKPIGIAAAACYLYPNRIRRWERDFTGLYSGRVVES